MSDQERTTNTTGQPPLEPLEAADQWDDPVVNFAAYQVRAGRTPWKAKKCEHNSVLYSASERRVWCRECNSSVDAFDAFLNLVHHFQGIVREAKREWHKATEAARAVIIRRAAKAMDKSWGRGMAPCCPHCHRGLLAHDFENEGSSAVSAELEIARRKKALEDQP